MSCYTIAQYTTERPRLGSVSADEGYFLFFASLNRVLNRIRLRRRAIPYLCLQESALDFHLAVVQLVGMNIRSKHQQNRKVLTY